MIKDRLMYSARQVKHAGYVGLKRTRFRTKKSFIVLRTKYYDLTVGDYHFEYGRYHHEFVDRTPPASANDRSVPEVIYCLWTGENPINSTRRKSLDVIRRLNGNIDIRLVTPDNLGDFIVKDHPLHPAYHNLSFVHRSDYLRAYLMHYFGGGYCDIKEPRGPWRPFFDRLQSNSDRWVIGYRELDSFSGGRLPRLIGRDISRNYMKLVGQSGFIMRPGSSLTAEWLREVERRLNYYADALAEHPGDAYGNNPGYPIGWTGILGKILAPLLLKYSNRLIIDDGMLLTFENYR